MDARDLSAVFPVQPHDRTRQELAVSQLAVPENPLRLLPEATGVSQPPGVVPAYHRQPDAPLNIFFHSPGPFLSMCGHRDSNPECGVRSAVVYPLAYSRNKTGSRRY
jgi:hypothetical protein